MTKRIGFTNDYGICSIKTQPKARQQMSSEISENKQLVALFARFVIIAQGFVAAATVILLIGEILSEVENLLLEYPDTVPRYNDACLRLININ